MDARYQPLPVHGDDGAASPLPSPPIENGRRSLSDIVMPAHLSFGRMNAFNFRMMSEDRESTSEEDSEDGREGFAAEESAEKGLLGRWGGEERSTLYRDDEPPSLVPRSRLYRRICLTICGLLATVFVVAAVGGSAGLRTANRYTGTGLRKITFEDAMSGVFSPNRKSISWLREAGDGVHSEINDEGIVLINIESNTTTFLARHDKLQAPNGERLQWNNFKVSADLRYVLVDTDVEAVWRHSRLANFWVHDTQSSTTIPVGEHSTPPVTSFMSWSPRGHALAYVSRKDLYVLPSPGSTPVRITSSGAPTKFNGLCDWVYEEEMFSRAEAIWWSPDASRLAFLSFDETEVPEYEFPVYSTGVAAGEEPPYTRETVMRYPKPGYPNPKATLRVFDFKEYQEIRDNPADAANRVTRDLVFDREFDEADKLITEVAWVSANDLVVTQTNRISTVQRTAHFDLSKSQQGQGSVQGKVVREVDWAKRDGGWFDAEQNITPLDPLVQLALHESAIAQTYPPGYLDILPDPSGYRHIAYFSPPETSEPIFLTSGKWEVDGGIKGVDLKNGVVYFSAAKPSIERHIFSIPLPKDLSALRSGVKPPEPTALTDTTSPGWYTASFSPFAGYLLLGEEGPGVPRQRLISARNTSFDQVLEDNAELQNTLKGYSLTNVLYSTLKTANGEDMNAMEIRPPNMDLSGRTKYPVLVRVYGGPASQMVQTRWVMDWHHYLVSSLHYLVLVVDGRGTGFKGRAFRSPVRNQLGLLEAQDVVEAARQYAAQDFVDEDRVGVWGWSYGGYLTSKVIETNSSVFSLGMAVAPVTDWKFYDTLYTERYMSTPQQNPEGYRRSAVRNMTGFQNTAFALAHGTGDDNVHFLNSATLLDRFTANHVRNFRFRMFTDSNHRISTRGAYTELHRWLADFLIDRWGETRDSKAEPHKAGW